MKRFFFFLLVLMVSGAGLRAASSDVRALQDRLKQGGFYQGEPTGVYDSETAAAVTRYQIRNGLPITGKLDDATAKALGVAPSKKKEAAQVKEAEGTWRRLRNGDMEFLEKLNSGEIPPPRPPAHDSAAAAKAPTSAPRAQAATPRQATPPPAKVRPAPNRPAETTIYGAERLRDYVGAFVLAGLDPRVGSELEFFADRVDYFGEHNVARDKIRRDLVRYDRQWPDRRFWLAGNLQVGRQRGGMLEVTFPLRYELRGHGKRASGAVLKTLILRRSGDRDLEIVGVRERKR